MDNPEFAPIPAPPPVRPRSPWRLAPLVLLLLLLWAGSASVSQPAPDAQMARNVYQTCQVQLAQLRAALNEYEADHGRYPADLAPFQNLPLCPLAKGPEDRFYRPSSDGKRFELSCRVNHHVPDAD